MVVDLYNATLQKVDFKKLNGGGATLGKKENSTPLSENFQKSGHARASLIGSML